MQKCTSKKTLQILPHDPWMVSEVKLALIMGPHPGGIKRDEPVTNNKHDKLTFSSRPIELTLRVVCFLFYKRVHSYPIDKHFQTSHYMYQMVLHQILPHRKNHYYDNLKFTMPRILKINVSPVESPKMLTLESVKTKTTTSRGYESSYIFIEVVLFFGL
jgi:hypothetical protein